MGKEALRFVAIEPAKAERLKLARR